MTYSTENTRDESILTDANLLSRLDRAPVTRKLRVAISVLILVWLLESFDIGLISILILVLEPEWNLTSGQIGVLGACGTIGILIGLLIAGRIADIYGRKKTLIVGTFVLSVFTLLCGFATNYTQLVIFRTISGLGAGAIFPIPYLMISELVNKNSRGRIMGYAQWVLNAGYMLPALAGLWAVAVFTPDWSWRMVCFIGGILSMVMIPALYIWAPESPRYLLRRARVLGDQNARAAANALVEEIEKEANIEHDRAYVDADVLQTIQNPKSQSAGSLAQLLKKPYLKRSVVSYCALTASFIVWYTFLTYAPKIFNLLGATDSNALLYTGVMMFISAFGIFYQGMLADKIGRKPTFGLYMAMAALGLVLLPFENQIGMTLVVIGALLTSWFGLGSFAVSKMYMAEQYPTRLRGAGVSAGEMISRGLTGGVFVSILPALFSNFGVAAVLIGAAVAMILLTLPMLFAGVETHGHSLEFLSIEENDPVRESA